MDSRWWIKKQQLTAFRAHIASLSPSTPRAYTLTKEQIDDLLGQKTGGLDGIRIYIGATIESGVMVPTLAIVGTELAGGTLVDYGIPPVIEAPSANRDGEEGPGGGGEGEEEEMESSLAEPQPCPVFCGPDNALNSEE